MTTMRDKIALKLERNSDQAVLCDSLILENKGNEGHKTEKDKLDPPTQNGPVKGTSITTQTTIQISPKENNGPLEETSSDLTKLKDGRRSWIVCFSAFLIQVNIVGVLHVFGIFFVSFLKEFQCTKAEAAWLGSVAYGITMLFSPPISLIMNRFGNRIVTSLGAAICTISLVISSFVTEISVMFGTFSFLYGMGTCLAYTPTMTIAPDYFDKYMTFATGIMVSGSSCGTLLLSPITQTLIDNYGWRVTFRVLAGFTFPCVILGQCFKPLSYRPPREKTPKQIIKKSGARKLIIEMHLWKNKVFILFTLSMFLAMFGYYVPYVHIVSHAQDIGISATKGSMLVMILGGATATGRISFGKIVEHGFIDRINMHQISLIITGTASMLLPLIKSFAGLVTYVILLGMVDGCFVVLLPVLTATLAGAEEKVVAWGVLTGVASITFAAGPPIAGWIADHNGNYMVAFHISGVPVVLAAILMFFIPWAQRTGSKTNIMAEAKPSSEDLLVAVPPSPVTPKQDPDEHVQMYQVPPEIHLRDGDAHTVASITPSYVVLEMPGSAFSIITRPTPKLDQKPEATGGGGGTQIKAEVEMPKRVRRNSTPAGRTDYDSVRAAINMMEQRASKSKSIDTQTGTERIRPPRTSSKPIPGRSASARVSAEDMAHSRSPMTDMERVQQIQQLMNILRHDQAGFRLPGTIQNDEIRNEPIIYSNVPREARQNDIVRTTPHTTPLVIHARPPSAPIVFPTNPPPANVQRPTQTAAQNVANKMASTPHISPNKPTAITLPVPTSNPTMAATPPKKPPVQHTSENDVDKVLFSASAPSDLDQYFKQIDKAMVPDLEELREVARKLQQAQARRQQHWLNQPHIPPPQIVVDPQAQQDQPVSQQEPEQSIPSLCTIPEIKSSSRKRAVSALTSQLEMADAGKSNETPSTSTRREDTTPEGAPILQVAEAQLLARSLVDLVLARSLSHVPSPTSSRGSTPWEINTDYATLPSPMLDPGVQEFISNTLEKVQSNTASDNTAGGESRSPSNAPYETHMQLLRELYQEQSANQETNDPVVLNSAVALQSSKLAPLPTLREDEEGAETTPVRSLSHSPHSPRGEEGIFHLSDVHLSTSTEVVRSDYDGVDNRATRTRRSRLRKTSSSKNEFGS